MNVLNTMLRNGFKLPEYDIHRLSKYIFAGSLFLSAALTLFIVTRSWPLKPVDTVQPLPPVVMLVQSIPEIEDRVASPAPPAPSPVEIPQERGEPVPDEVAIDESAEPVQDAIVPESATGPSGGTEATASAISAGHDAGIGNQLYDVSAVEEPPRRLSNTVPDYPPIALRAGIEGTIVLKALVNVQGTVDSVEVMNGPEVFRNAAVEAANATSFSPARLDRNPVACWVIMQYRFNTRK